MKNDLSCAVVRDLLPSYIEGLTETETNEAVERHLAACPACRALREAMTADAKSPQAEEKEQDYLRTINKKGRAIKIAAAILLILAALWGSIALKLFIIGDPASAAGMAWTITEQENGIMCVDVVPTWSGVTYCRWNTRKEGDSVYITARKVLPSVFTRNYESENRTGFSTKGIKNVYLAERLIWSEGEAT